MATASSRLPAGAALAPAGPGCRRGTGSHSCGPAWASWPNQDRGSPVRPAERRWSTLRPAGGFWPGRARAVLCEAQSGAETPCRLLEALRAITGDRRPSYKTFSSGRPAEHVTKKRRYEGAARGMSQSFDIIHKNFQSGDPVVISRDVLLHLKIPSYACNPLISNDKVCRSRFITHYIPTRLVCVRAQRTPTCVSIHICNL